MHKLHYKFSSINEIHDSSYAKFKRFKVLKNRVVYNITNVRHIDVEYIDRCWNRFTNDCIIFFKNLQVAIIRREDGGGYVERITPDDLYSTNQDITT